MPEYRVINGIRCTVTQPDDPAYPMLSSGHVSTPEVYRGNCYICVDPEFAQLGMPLCIICPECEIGHIPADDVTCDDCGFDYREEPHGD